MLMLTNTYKYKKEMISFFLSIIVLAVNILFISNKLFLTLLHDLFAFFFVFVLSLILDVKKN